MRGGPVLVTAVGSAGGARAAAAALACAGAETHGAGLLIEVGGGPRPRPGLVAGAEPRRLEERLAAHLPDAGVAARGGVCFVSLGGEDGLAGLGGALAIGRDAFCVLHVSPPLLRAALAATEGTASAALLRADARGERPLLALVCGDLIACGMRVAVLKRELAWLGARLALAGAVSAQAFLPERLVARLTDGPVAG